MFGKTAPIEKLYMRIPEAAAALGVTPYVIKRAIKKGRLTGLYLGDKPIIPRIEVERILDRLTQLEDEPADQAPAAAAAE